MQTDNFSTNNQAVKLLLNKEETQMFCNLLTHYPVTPDEAPPITSTGFQNSAEYQERQQMLQDALKEQRAEQKNMVVTFLNTPDRITLEDSIDQIQYCITIQQTEIEFLLQVFNDIRVGYWMKLGEKEMEDIHLSGLTHENIARAVIMDAAGYFEELLIEKI